MIEMCSKPKSKEAFDLIERHSHALFGDEVTGLLNIEDVFMTSFASLKRFLLEAVAFGSFLWDIEHCVNAVYTLKEHKHNQHLCTIYLIVIRCVHSKRRS